MFIHAPPSLLYDDLEVTKTPGIGRLYTTPNGIKYPSVTTVLSIQDKSSLHEWRARVGEEEANKVSRRAAGRGTRFHKMCEDYINNKDPYRPKDMPHVKANFKSVKGILDSRLGKIYGVESALYSRFLRVAGRTDLIAEFDGVLSVIDFKTSLRLKQEEWIHSYFKQESFYAVAWEELTGMPVPNLVTIIAVDGQSEGQVFVQHRDNWISKFIEIRDEFEKRKLFGHV